MEQIKKALQACNFSPWTIHTLQNKFNYKHNIHNVLTDNSTTQHTNNTNNSGSNNKNISTVVPYIHGLGKGWKGYATTWLSRYTSEGPTPLKTFSWPPRTGTTNYKRIGVIYKVKCPHINCSGVHRGIRQILWALAQGTLQGSIHYTPAQSLHRKPSKPQLFHNSQKGITGGTRNIKEVMYIWVNDPSLNRNLGKYQLPHIWDQIVQDTPLP